MTIAQEIRSRPVGLSPDTQVAAGDLASLPGGKTVYVTPPSPDPTLSQTAGWCASGRLRSIRRTVTTSACLGDDLERSFQMD
jgi:hypothetical protein